ncbi:MAG: DeoR/GlpR transcriptional regulator [Rhizobiales bacterium]|nr:DeoR/GlpR transcriptional regulator [Hyphomicrobiales bacterium]
MARKEGDQSLLNKVRKDLPTISRAFRRIAKFLLNAPDDFMHKTVQDLALLIEVSEPTLIRFCRHYGYSGMPDFRIGLALSKASNGRANNTMRLEPSFIDRTSINQKHKKAIANCAREFVKKGQSIIIDSGSTMSLFAETLKSSPSLTIFTTGLNVLETLWGCKQHKLILPGGIVRFDASALTGRMVEKSLAEMRFDIIFMGAGSVLPSVGLSTFDEDEAHQNRAMVNAASRLILLVDSSKFKQPALHKICSIERIHAVITDDEVDLKDVEMLENAGVKVIIAGK